MRQLFHDGEAGQRKIGSTFSFGNGTLTASAIRMRKMSIVNRLFLDHPASVDETYLEHLSTASGFGGRLILAGLACFLHGLLPCCFTRTASDQIRTLNRDMDSRRAARPAVDLGTGAVG
jgi:hypothetical protein